jgi:hypothetical protein
MKKAILPCLLTIWLLQAWPLVASERLQFQQEASHVIRATLDDERHLLHAHITTIYVNNSPDTLSEIFIHLWPNAWSGNETAFARELLEIGKTDFHFAAPHERGYIDSLAFTLDGRTAVWGSHPQHIDIAILYPDQPVLPGDTLVWSTPFRLKFPHSRFCRLGHNQQAYHATQWYPKPAVYDRFGWHPMPYLSYSEFYSEFGNVDLFLTLPRNYVVASTGEVMNLSEQLWLDELASQTAGATPDQLPARHDFPPSDTQLKTIHLRQERVHDFAWVADKRFYVAKSRVRLPGNGEMVDSWAFFFDNARLWHKVPAYINETIFFFSNQLGAYPWPSKSAAQVGNSGDANMEYPAFTVLGNVVTEFEMERLVVHETAHNWFYGMLASNERSFPWMDEGFSQFFEKKFLAEKYPDHRLLGQLSSSLAAEYFNLAHFPYRDYYRLWYLFKARRNLDQPIATPAPEFTMVNYFGMAYYKAALALYYLEHYLGPEVFEAAMRQYVDTWAFRHPYPEDVQAIFESVSGEDLNWFFHDLLHTNGKIDYGFRKLSGIGNPQGNYLQLTVANAGDLAVPFPVSGLIDGDVVFTQWYKGFHGEMQLTFPAGDYDALVIDAGGVMPEICRRNNIFRPGALFPRRGPLELQPLGSLEDPHKTQLFFAPALGWNLYNGFMPGMAFYNTFFPYRPTQWLIMPMYATANDGFTGIAFFEHSIFPMDGAVHSWKGGVSLRRFGLSTNPSNWYFNRLQTRLDVTLRKPYARSSLERSFWLRNVWVMRDSYAIVNQQPETRRIDYYVNELGYTHADTRVLNPWSAALQLQQGKGFARVSAEARLSRHYPGSIQGVSLRLFAGSFLVRPQAGTAMDYRFRLGGLRGRQDFLFDHNYLGRNEPIGTLWGNQLWETDGGLKFPTSVGQTWDWLLAVNIKAELPLLPAKLYFDAGTYAGAATAFSGSMQFPWVLGVQLVPFKDLLEINFPIKTSADLEQVAGFTMESYWERVTFSLYLHRLNPFQFLRELEIVRY